MTNSDKRCAVAAWMREIDPTCYIVSTISYDWPGPGGSIYRYDLSCGHMCETSWPEPPAFCDQCGARVVEKEVVE